MKRTTTGLCVVAGSVHGPNISPHLPVRRRLDAMA